MRRFLLLSTIIAAFSSILSSCGTNSEPDPVAPTSNTSNRPWNTPVPGAGGGGMMGMMPQNQFRR